MARRKAPRARRRNQIAKRGGAGRSRARSAVTARKKSTARKSAARPARGRKSARLRTASAKQARPSKASRTRGKASAAQVRARKATASRAQLRKTSEGQPRKARKTAAQVSRKTARAASAAVRPPSKPAFVARKAPSLDRERRIARDDDDMIPTPPSSLDLDRSASAARSGRRELHERFVEHTETSPAITGGDIDADWESAYTVGDEAPGGDNPTPDQDIVDDIGRAIGVQYEDNEELKGETKIAERDRKRWELDPASSEDYNDR